MERPLFVRGLGVAVPTTVVMMMIWAAFIVPDGAPWTGVVWFAGLAVLLLGAATLFVGLAKSAHLATSRRAPTQLSCAGAPSAAESSPPSKEVNG
jgi:uncharacterized membrane protein